MEARGTARYVTDAYEDLPENRLGLQECYSRCWGPHCRREAEGCEARYVSAAVGWKKEAIFSCMAVRCRLRM
jgi:hypothetical protein